MPLDEPSPPPPPRERRVSSDRRRGPRRLSDEPPANPFYAGRPPNAVDLHQMPYWLRAAVFLGVPSVIALFLVYMLSVDVSKRMVTVEGQVTAGVATVTRIDQALARRENTTEGLRQHIDEQIQLLNDNLKRLCVAISETPAERASCLTRGRVE